jgi:hypothetical protein
LGLTRAGTPKRPPVSRVSTERSLAEIGLVRASHGSVGITVWSGSTLVFSSDWTGSSTRERALEHGTVHVT